MLTPAMCNNNIAMLQCCVVASVFTGGAEATAPPSTTAAARRAEERAAGLLDDEEDEECGSGDDNNTGGSESDGALLAQPDPDELYDAAADDADEAWVAAKRQGRQSDAILSWCVCVFGVWGGLQLHTPRSVAATFNSMCCRTGVV